MAADPANGPLHGPWRITFDTNPDDCNIACVMCEEHSDFSEKKRLRVASHRPHRRMDISVIHRVVSEMAPHGLREIIPSTMGEPLLYEHFDEIIEICREFGVRLNLTTNGTWPHRGPVAWAELLCPVMSDVKVSWNGITPETQESIMKGSRHARRVEDLRAFLRVRDEVSRRTGNRCQVTLQCTFMETNLSELPSLVRFAADLGMDRVKGHHLWVHFGQLSTEDLRRSSESRRRWNQTVALCMQTAQDHLRADGTQVRLENFLPLSEESGSEVSTDWACPFLGREAWVNHAGRFDPCCAPDLERQSLGSFGLVTTNGGLRSIWNGLSYRALVAGYLAKPLCRKCSMRRPVTMPT
jgi:MoaA/NifB/PqqE/SkfB family radical SAM enzyme